MRILLVEDEQQLREALATQLRESGFSVDLAEDGRTAVFNVLNHPYDSVILDLGLPDIDGVSIIQQVRSKDVMAPILVLTARDDWQQKVSALEEGADDYLVKPFHYPELLARLNALMRRMVGRSTPVVTLGPVTLDTVKQEVTVNALAITLTAYEYRVLEYLMLHAGEVVSKTQLIEHIYDQDFDRDSNTIEVFVRRLRKKIDPEQQLNPIETLRGKGYRFDL